MQPRILITCLALTIGPLIGCSAKRPAPVTLSPTYSYIRNALHTTPYQTPQDPPTGQAVAER